MLFRSRIGTTIRLNAPSMLDMVRIYKLGLKKIKWRVDHELDQCLLSEFKLNIDTLKPYGGDLSNLISLSVEDAVKQIFPNFNESNIVRVENFKNALKKINSSKVKEVYQAMYI